MIRFLTSRREVQGLERLVDVLEAVDPDLVIVADEGFLRALALPFRYEKRRLVHHVADAEHETAAGRLQIVESRHDLAAEARRLLVDDEDIRPESLGGLENEGLAQADRLVEAHVEVEAAVIPVRQLGDAGNADVVDAAVELEIADDRGAGDDDDRGVGTVLDDGVGKGPRPAQMSEAEGVVAVDKDSRSAGMPGLHRGGSCIPIEVQHQVCHAAAPLIGRRSIDGASPFSTFYDPH